MRKLAEIEREIERVREERTNRAEALLTAEAEVTKARARRDESKATFELNLSTGKELGKSEKDLKLAETDLWVAERKVDGTATAVTQLEERLTGLGAELRKARENAYVSESEKVLREIRGLQQNLLGPLRRAWMLAEAMQGNQGNRLERFRVDAVRVRYTDPVLIQQKIPHVLHMRQVKVGGLDSPLVPVETFAPDPRATEVLEWLPYPTFERLSAQGKCVLVEEKAPVFDEKRVFDPLPEIYDSLTDLDLGHIVLHGAVPAMKELAAVIGPDLMTSAIGPTVTKQEMESYLGEVER